jgi:NADH dehydrogenase
LPGLCPLQAEAARSSRQRRGHVRIVVLGGGFGGVAAARHLERLLRGHRDVEITLVSRENFFVLTPLLFEACTGRLELRHCAEPIRAALRRAHFLEATVEGVDVEARVARAVAADGARLTRPCGEAA